MEHPVLESLLEEKAPIVVWVSLTMHKFQVRLKRFWILKWNCDPSAITWQSRMFFCSINVKFHKPCKQNFGRCYKTGRLPCENKVERCEYKRLYFSRLGIRLHSRNSNLSDQIEAAALSFRNNFIDIYSNSWGPGNMGWIVVGPGPLLEIVLKNGTRSVSLMIVESCPRKNLTFLYVSTYVRMFSG